MINTYTLYDVTDLGLNALVGLRDAGLIQDLYLNEDGDVNVQV